MPRLVKTLQAFGVHVQQRAGLRPLKAPKRLALAARPTREPVALQHLPDRRAGAPQQPGQPARTEIGAPTRLANPLLLELV
jgi:hypothetical protein